MDLNLLSKRAHTKGQYQLVAALDAAMAVEATLDDHINVVGAAHEVGLLRNSLAPLWAKWRSDADGWAARCIQRLLMADHDYWALAALLGLSNQTVLTAANDSGFRRFALTSYGRFDQPPVHLAAFSLRRAGRVLAPVLEIGWDIASLEVVDVRRWRAVLLPETLAADSTAELTATGSYYLRAQPPHGAWRVVDDELFRIRSSDLLEPLNLPATWPAA